MENLNQIKCLSQNYENSNSNDLENHYKYFDTKEYIYNLQNKSFNFNMMSLYKDKYKMYSEKYNIEIANKLFHIFIKNNYDKFINKYNMIYIDFTKFTVIDVFIFQGIKYPGVDITILLTDGQHTLDMNYSIIDNNDDYSNSLLTVDYDMENISEHYNFHEYINDVLDLIEN